MPFLAAPFRKKQHRNYTTSVASRHLPRKVRSINMVKTIDMEELISEDFLDLSSFGLSGEGFSFLATDAAEFAPTGNIITLQSVETFLPEDYHLLTPEEQREAYAEARSSARRTFRATTKAPQLGDKRKRSEAVEGQARWVWDILDEGFTDAEAYAVYHGGTLQRLSHIGGTNQQTGVDYDQITGVFRARIDFGLVNPDGREIPIEAVITKMVNEDTPEGKKISVKRFREIIGQLGVDYQKAMSFMWNHMGTNPDVVKPLFAAFERFGAIPDTDINEPGRIQRVLKMPTPTTPGMPITRLEVGSNDRSFMTNKQGFIDVVNSAVENSFRVINTRQEAVGLGRAIKKAKDNDTSLDGKTAKPMSEAELREAQALKTTLYTMSRRYAASLTGGVQIFQPERNANNKVKNEQAPKLVPTEKIGPLNAPVGRFTGMVHQLNSDGSLVIDPETSKPVLVEQEFDLWKNSNQGTPAVPPAVATETVDSVVASATDDDDDDDDPTDDLFGGERTTS